MNGSGNTSNTSRPMAINNCGKKVNICHLNNLKKQSSWQDELAGSDMDIPGSPRTPRTSTTPGIYLPFFV